MSEDLSRVKSLYILYSLFTIKQDIPVSDYTQVKWINVDSMINECGADRHKCCVWVQLDGTEVSVTLSGRLGREGQGKVVELCCPSGVTNLIFDFAHLSTRFTVKFNRRETCFTLPLSASVTPLCQCCLPCQCCPALQFYCHIFAHDLTKCAENAAFIFAQTVEQQQKKYHKKPVQSDNIWCSMQTTSGLNAHKNTSYSIYISHMRIIQIFAIFTIKKKKLCLKLSSSSGGTLEPCRLSPTYQ